MNVFIIIWIVATTGIMIYRSRNAGNEELVKKIDMVSFIMTMPMTMFFNYMADLLFILSTKKVTVVIMLAILKIIGLIIAYKKKSPKFMSAMVLLLVCDLFLIGIFYIYGVERMY